MTHSVVPKSAGDRFSLLRLASYWRSDLTKCLVAQTRGTGLERSERPANGGVAPIPRVILHERGELLRGLGRQEQVGEVAQDHQAVDLDSVPCAVHVR